MDQPSTQHDFLEQTPIDSLSTRSNPQFFRSAARLGIQAAEALQRAHDQGVLHRDIKPGNLLLDAEGKVYVADFGLARLEADAGVTMTGDVIGTLRYMSPEQALANPAIVDHRTEIYSLGASLYELLTLQRVFKGSDRQEVLRQLADADPIAPRRIDPALPRDLETVVLKALAKDPVDRYASASELADDLRRFSSDHPIHAKPPGMVAYSRKWVRRNRTFAASTAVTHILAGIIAGVLLWRERQQTLAALSRAKQQQRLASEIVDKFYLQFALKLARLEPARTSMRREFVEAAATYFEGLLNEPESDEATHLLAARANAQLARLYHERIELVPPTNRTESNWRIGATQQPNESQQPDGQYRHAMDGWHPFSARWHPLNAQSSCMHSLEACVRCLSPVAPVRCLSPVAPDACPQSRLCRLCIAPFPDAFFADCFAIDAS